MPTGSDFHLLRHRDGELCAPLNTEATWLLIRLEARGITVTADGTDLVVRPKGAITDAERADLLRLKRHVLVALAYVPPGVH